MGRSKLILVSLAGMFLLAGSLYAQKAGTYSVAFTGYCDSLSLTISANGFVTGTHINYDCDGDDTWVDGVLSLPIDRYDPYEFIGPVALSDNIGEVEYDGGAMMLYLNFTNMTFSYYLESGGVLPESYINSGYISYVQDEVPASSKGPSWKRSTAAHAAAPDLNITGYPAGTYELLLYDNTGTFEYCDFFQLSAYGDLAGGTHNFATSCLEPNAPTGGSYAYLTDDVVVIGPNGNIGETGRSLLTTENYDDVTLNYYFNFNESVWSLYETDGTTGLQLDNWGFFTLVGVDPLTGTAAPHPVGGTPSNTRNPNLQ